MTAAFYIVLILWLITLGLLIRSVNHGLDCEGRFWRALEQIEALKFGERR